MRERMGVRQERAEQSRDKKDEPRRLGIAEVHQTKTLF